MILKNKNFLILPVIVLLIFWLLIHTSGKSIAYEHISILNGLYIYSENNEILDGNYRCTTDIGSDKTRENTILLEFADGIPKGLWSETHGNELIHSGEYLDEKKISSTLKSLTKSSRVDLNLWKVGNYPYLSLELIHPATTDSLTILNAIEFCKKNLAKKYSFKAIRIDSIGGSEIKRNIFHN